MIYGREWRNLNLKSVRNESIYMWDDDDIARTGLLLLRVCIVLRKVVGECRSLSKPPTCLQPYKIIT